MAAYRRGVTPHDPGRRRLAAWAGESESSSAGDELLAGARARTAQAVRVAAQAYAATHESEAWRPDGAEAGRPSRRWSVSWRAALAGAVVLVLVGAVVVLRSLSGAPDVLVSTAQASFGGSRPVAAGGDSADQAPPATATPAAVTVHVVGAVLTPGVVSLVPGSRAIDAVRAAGGTTPVADLARVNLARVLSDGEQLVVPAAGEQGASGVSAGSGTATGGALDLNSADAAALEVLPRIGPVLAARIVAWRTAHGRFSSVDELGEVPGIGAGLMSALDGLVHV